MRTIEYNFGRLHEEVLRGRASEIAKVLGERPGAKGEIVFAAAASSELGQ